ncbi:MAG: DUF4325 domain-containing protein [Deltaproteobacteria bacterium]|nr:DUF4325 domain-containing protein [Deltaproteobacteria bacterium]
MNFIWVDNMVDNCYYFNVDTKEQILKIIIDRRTITGAEIARQLGITRQAVNKHLKAMVKSGLIFKCGNTRDGFYTSDSKIPCINKEIRRRFIENVSGLKEDILFNKVDMFLGLKNLLKENVYNIFHYVFTEMVNNVIDHSKSDVLSTIIKINDEEILCEIRDYGIGVFESLRSKFSLQNELDAYLEIIKGKKTTQPDRHSGEGIFFSSKVSDKFIIRSHRLEVIFDNLKSDIFVKENRYLKGTCVTFYIKRYSKKRLKDIFDIYSKEEFNYEFSTTTAKVKLYGDDLISRSEAKRLLAGLENFKEIILDFDDVKSIGQGFADEIFRVFKNRYPNINIIPLNANSVIDAMIKHVLNNNI